MAVDIEVAHPTGACYGVNRALEMARAAAASSKAAHTLGPLIHNPRVVEELAAQGCGVAKTLDEAAGGTLVLRSHGTSPDLIAEAQRRDFEIVDATCPYVSKVQQRARELGEQGYSVVIIGEPGHAEVESIRAWAKDAVVCVADTPDKVPAELPSRVGVVVQTTQSQDHVDAVLAAVRDRAEEVKVEETVCFATRKRQAASAELASRVECMLVIGGHNSGNTTRLAEICASLCPRTHHIEDAHEIDLLWFSDVSTIGIAAGASTPAEQVDALVAHLRRML